LQPWTNALRMFAPLSQLAACANVPVDPAFVVQVHVVPSQLIAKLLLQVRETLQPPPAPKP
jgi:hypothetical protein